MKMVWSRRWSGFFYDAEFRLTGGEVRSGDGAELIAETTHEYDATGVLVRTYTESFLPTGEDSETLYECNADHTFCIKRIDQGADGSVDETWEVTYDALGLVIRVYDVQNQGWCDWTYDHANLWVLAPGAQLMLAYNEVTRHARVTSNNCGQSDVSDNGEEFFYDEHGNLLRTEYSIYDIYPEPTHFTTFYYDCWQ